MANPGAPMVRPTSVVPGARLTSKRPFSSVCTNARGTPGAVQTCTAASATGPWLETTLKDQRLKG